MCRRGEMLKERKSTRKRDEDIMWELGLVLVLDHDHDPSLDRVLGHVLEALGLLHALQRERTALEGHLRLLLEAFEIVYDDASAAVACYETHLGRFVETASYPAPPAHSCWGSEGG